MLPHRNGNHNKISALLFFGAVLSSIYSNDRTPTEVTAFASQTISTFSCLHRTSGRSRVAWCTHNKNKIRFPSFVLQNSASASDDGSNADEASSSSSADSSYPSPFHSIEFMEDSTSSPFVPSASQSDLPPSSFSSVDLRRKERLHREEELNQRYVNSNASQLQELRSNINSKEKELKRCIRNKRTHDADALRREISELHNRDAEYVYRKTKQNLDKSLRENDTTIANINKMKNIMKDARSCIPHLNMEGLWVGKYGDHGYEMINITYTSVDTLIAYKVSGDKNVPKGEVTFKANLFPVTPSSTSIDTEQNSQQESSSSLPPIELSNSAAAVWGVKHLERFPGMGQVASEGFCNAQWMEGQLILVGSEYFSFAWVPIGHQIFFGRPGPELTLKMLRDAQRNKDDSEAVAEERAFVSKCYEETLVLTDEEDELDDDNCFFRNSNGIIYEEKGAFE